MKSDFSAELCDFFESLLQVET